VLLAWLARIDRGDHSMVFRQMLLTTQDLSGHNAQELIYDHGLLSS
jgi:hypothetical protein